MGTRQTVESCALCYEQAVRGCPGRPERTRLSEGRHTVGWDPSPGEPWPSNAGKGEDRHGEVGFTMRHRVSHAGEPGVRASPSQGLRGAARYVVRGGVRVAETGVWVRRMRAKSIVQHRHRQSAFPWLAKSGWRVGGWAFSRVADTCAQRDDDGLRKNKHKSTLGRSTADSPVRSPS